ncbi:MAG: MOSC domain-containing protein [Dehalococcoidia bacterium]|jgi:MOSC domain-containing protein YiiM
MPTIIAVNRSDKKGTSKHPLECGLLQEKVGLVSDAHAGGEEKREISLLAIESIRRMNAEGYDFKPGDFAENLTTSGIDLVSLPIGTQLRVGEKAILEITQIGKECHVGCAIYKKVGKCIMPGEGVFARVIRSGEVRAEDKIKIL